MHSGFKNVKNEAALVTFVWLMQVRDYISIGMQILSYLSWVKLMHNPLLKFDIQAICRKYIL